MYCPTCETHGAPGLHRGSTGYRRHAESGTSISYCPNCQTVLDESAF